MRNRFLFAARTLAAFVPTLAMAQQRPAQPPARPATPPPQRPATPPPQRPAAQPAQRPAAHPMMMAAHRDGSVELSVSGGVMTLDKQLSTDRIAPAGFARVTYNLNEHLGLSVGSGFGSKSSVTYIQPFAGLVWTANLNEKMSPFLTVGGGGTMARFSGTRRTGPGGFAGAGIRSMIGENLALRVEGRVQYENYSETTIPNAVFNGAASLGISYFAGGGPPRDTDADGVPDKRDRCASTPRGATVDVRGCPSDTDHDGVLNGLDRCPNTPPNTPVDTNGCTRDTDADGIADNLDRCPNTPSGVHVDANGCPVDSDRDGVADYQDRCANTPAGTPVDANGCPRDSDGDGVMDNADRCPNTPAGTPVDANGCPRDTDGDGVADNLDRCPYTAAGTQVDATGCPVARDTDHDGVVDDRDRCPNTPAGRQVDANGCPLAELPSMTTPIVLRSVAFRPGTARLLPSSQATLDPIAAAIVANPGSRFEVGGYTDASGVPAANLRLSQARAQAVMDYLASKGVAASALTAVGYGSQHPVAPNTTPAGRAQNRRVELKRLQ